MQVALALPDLHLRNCIVSRWNEEFEQLQFVRRWSRLEKMLQTIDRSLLSNKQVALEYARIKKVQKFIDKVLKGIDPEICNMKILVRAAPNLDNLINYVANFTHTNDLGTLQNANHELSEILSRIGQLLFTPSENEKFHLTSAVEAYSEAINEHINQQGQLFDKLKRDFIALQASITDQQEIRERAQKEYDTKHTEATMKLEEFVQGFDKKFEETEVSRSEKFKDELEKFNSEAQENLHEMRKKKEDAQKILGVIIDATHAGSYKKQANEDKESADNLRKISIVLMVIASVLLGLPIALSTIWTGLFEFSWKEIFNRTAVSSAFFITAIYCARESTKHRQNEQKNRRSELTLVSAGPFLALLDDNAEKEAIKLRIANKLFIDETRNELDDELDDEQ